MIRRSTWMMLAIFALLLASTLIWQRNKGVETVDETEATTVPVVSQSLLDLTNRVVLGITFTGPEGKNIIVTRESATSPWTITGVPTERADTIQIETITGQLFALRVLKTLESSPGEEALGLVNPAYTITLHLEDGASRVLKIGDLTPTSSGYYVQLDDQKPVVVAKYDLEAVLAILDNPPLLPTPSPEPTEDTAATVPTPSITPEGLFR